MVSTNLAKAAPAPRTDRHGEVGDLSPVLFVIARRFYRSEEDAKALVAEAVSMGKTEAASPTSRDDLKLRMFRIMHRLFMAEIRSQQS
jgi:hypothetical protein